MRIRNDQYALFLSSPMADADRELYCGVAINSQASFSSPLRFGGPMTAGIARTFALFLFAAANPGTAIATDESGSGAASPPLIPCGSLSARPWAARADGTKVRLCLPPTSRNYSPRNSGIGFTALDIESEACFVPDSAYRTMDEIIDAVRVRLDARIQPAPDVSISERARAIGQVTGDVLAEMGFALYVPTEMMGDMLVPRSEAEEKPRYVTDCDTSSLVLLTVAEALGARASLVEINLPTGEGHNFVRWQVGGGRVLDWDMNARAECSAPTDSPGFQGMAMTSEQTMSYLLSLRAEKHLQSGDILKALADNREAIRKFPGHPRAYNNFCWTVATAEFDERAAMLAEAIGYSKKLLSIHRVPATIDTAACLAAYAGDFTAAVELVEEALQAQPGDLVLESRLAGFKSLPPRDCTGAN
ncbi:hypothetical protein MRS76_18290 [Rhizobiaceae bacterium n13]|uniref:Tetratricopeptide repeat protein n=1 Tax=Ferirhizobium litorale TaxID=2927786 RepID=A0AAE3QEA3_9HYPH|nr:hypothetical protein [Fererhizobium litorale]MDI7863906.1 hypothetical protein [Fererhizobium litorale]MDI7924262.1 hypothetical protein [Fererhizobium litorale]